jgi:hypothetical protein
MAFLKKGKLKVNGGTYTGMACPQVADRRDGIYILRLAVNIFNKQSRTADRE